MITEFNSEDRVNSGEMSIETQKTDEQFIEQVNLIDAINQGETLLDEIVMDESCQIGYDHNYHQTNHFSRPLNINANAFLSCSFTECCDLTFNHQPNLLRHTRLKYPDSLHPMQLKSFRNVRRPKSSNLILKMVFTSKIKCSLCDKWFLRQDGLEIHVIHEHMAIEVVTGGFGECARTLESDAELEKHRGMHQRQPENQGTELNEPTNDKPLKTAKLLFDSDSNDESMDDGDSVEESFEEIVLENYTDLDEKSMDGMGLDEKAVKKMDSIKLDLQSQQLDIQQQTFTELANANSIHYVNVIKNCNNLNQLSVTTLNPEILINANPLPIYSLSYNLFQNPIDYNYNLNSNVLMESNSIQNNNSNIQTFQSNQPEFTEIHHPMSQQIDQSHTELIPMQFTNAMPVQQQFFVSNIDCQQSIISTQTQPMLYRNNFIQMTNNQVNPSTQLSTPLSDSIVLQTNRLPSIIAPSSIYQFSANWDQSNPNSTQSTPNHISTQSIVHLNPPTEQSQPEHQAIQLSKLIIIQSSVNCPECGKWYINKNSLDAHRSTVHSKQMTKPKGKSELLNQSTKTNKKLENLTSNSSTSIPSNSTSILSNPLPNNQTNSLIIMSDPATNLSSSPSPSLQLSSISQPSSVTTKKRSYRKQSNQVILSSHVPGQDTLMFICTEDNCGKTFCSQYALKRHKRIVHQGKQYFNRCTWVGCGLKFPGTFLLRKHREEAHTGVTVYNCDYPQCKHTTSDKGHMTKHRQLVHEKALIKCKYANCSQMFSNYGKLMRHRRSVHTAGGKYKCEVKNCRLGFDSIAFLRRHWERKHKIAD